MNKFKQHPVLLFFSILFLVFGLWFILDDAAKIISLVYGVIGVCLIVTGAAKLLMKHPKYTYDGLVNIVIGIVIMFFHNFILTIILGAIFIVFPLVRICLSNMKKDAIKRELPYLIFGLVIILCGDIFTIILIKIIGVIFLILSLFLFVSIFTKKVININDFMFYVNSEGRELSYDNVIDVEYEEVDGDE